MSEHTTGTLWVNEDSGRIGDVWSVDHDKPFCQIQATGPYREDVHHVERKANAREVVHRWNSYPAMMEALEEALDHIKKGYGTDDVVADLSTKTTSVEVIEMINSALAQARREEKGV